MRGGDISLRCNFYNRPVTIRCQRSVIVYKYFLVMYSNVQVLLFSFANVLSMASSPASQSGSEKNYCEVCDLTMHEEDYYGHLRGNRHKKHFKWRQDTGIEIPSETALLIEQDALYNDAISHYVYSVCKRTAIRWRL